jgi:YrbI family 3-deoxy-D-manno-octulosonate 8-phosphate phosphatase
MTNSLEQVSPRAMKNWRQMTRLLSRVEVVIFDFDGVMTDNRVWVRQDGTESVACNRSDGLAFKLLEKLKLPSFILSKEENPVLSARARKLKIDCFQNIDDKLEFLRTHLPQRSLALERSAYVGNDVNDVACMKRSLVSFAPADGYPEALAAATVVLERRGGHGAVREAIELVARAKLQLGAKQSPWSILGYLD